MGKLNVVRVALAAVVAIASSANACAAAHAPSPRRAESLGSAATDSCASGSVHLRALIPATVNLSAGDVSPVEILGCGFADSNTVNVGPATISGVASLDAGTRIRFVVPLTLPSRGEVPPMRMLTGTVDVTVTARNVTSNRLSLVLK
jgi:hypothetical protein